jgi:MFS family permease
MSKNKLIALIPFWLFILFFKFSGNIHYSFLPTLGDKLTQTWIVGIIISLQSFFQLMMDVPAGFLLDKFGYTKMLRVGTIIFIISALILAFVPGLTGFIITTIGSALGWLFFMPGVNAYILSTASKENAEKFMVARDIFNSTGVVLGCLVLVLFINSSATVIGLISVAIFFIALFFIWISPKDTISVHEEKKLIHHHYYIRRNIFKKLFKNINKLNPASWMLILQGICGSIFYSVAWFTVPLMIADPGKKIFGISLGIFDFAIIVLGSFLGKLSQKIKERYSVIVGLLIFSLAGFFLGRQIEWFFLIFGFLATAGDELSSISLWSWLDKLNIDDKTDGEIASVISFFQDLGWTIGPVCAGILYSVFGGELTLSFGAIPILITFVISTILIIKHGHTISPETYLHQYPKRIRGKK